MTKKLDEDLEELESRTTTGSHEVRNKAIGEAQVKNIQAIRNLNKKVGRLTKTITKLNKENNKLNNRIFWLTVITIVLSIVNLVQAADTIIRWTK